MEQYILSLLHILIHGGGDRLNTIDQLKTIDQTSLLYITRRLLEDTDSDKKLQGIEGLMVTRPEENVDLILPLLNDTDPDVRWAAIHYITRTNKFLEKSEIISLVIKSLLEDPSPDVRLDAAEALGYCKAPEAKAALLWARDHDFSVGFQGHVVSVVAEDALERFDSSMDWRWDR